MPFLGLLAFVVVVPTVLAGTYRQDIGIAHLDHFLQERAHNATKFAIEAYNRNPESAILKFNKQIQQ